MSSSSSSDTSHVGREIAWKCSAKAGEEKASSETWAERDNDRFRDCKPRARERHTCKADARGKASKVWSKDDRGFNYLALRQVEYSYCVINKI